KDLILRDDAVVTTHDFMTDSLVNSPDGQRLAYVAGIGKYLAPPNRPWRLTRHPLVWAEGVDKSKRFVVVDGVGGRAYEAASAPVFSPDGKHVAYKAKEGKRWFVVLDGQEQKGFDALGSGKIVFSADSRRMAYVARSGAKWSVIVDGNESVHDDVINDPVFSPDSRRVAYVMREGNQWITVVDGQRGPG